MAENEFDDTGEFKMIKANNYSVAERRKWVAEKYFNHTPPALLFKEYTQKYQLTRHSFDRDITVIRQEVPYSVRENYEQIVNNTLADIDTIIANSLEDEDRKTALQAIKNKLDLLKMVNPDKAKVNSVSVSQTNNINLSQMSLEDLRQLLGKSNPVGGDATDIEFKDLG